MKKVFSKIYVPVAWFILCEILMLLPGSKLPGGGLFDIPHFDKIVHSIIFGNFVAFWCLYYSTRPKTAAQLRNIFFVVFLIAVVNGILIEYLQFNYVPGRSFDEGDIVADVTSAGFAYGLCNVLLAK